MGRVPGIRDGIVPRRSIRCWLAAVRASFQSYAVLYADEAHYASLQAASNPRALL